MAETLKNLIESYQKGELSTPNMQVIDKIFSDEIINLPDDVLLDLTFSRAFFKKSRLTKIRFCNGSFGSSFFKDCLFMDCIFVDSEISETIFESCTFSNGSVDGSEFQSCRFINTVFRDVTFGFGTLIHHSNLLIYDFILPEGDISLISLLSL